MGTSCQQEGRILYNQACPRPLERFLIHFQEWRRICLGDTATTNQLVMTPASQSTYTADELAVMFFRQVKKDLAIPSTRQMVSLVGLVLSHLIRGMSIQKTSVLLNRLPNLFQMLLLKDWRYNNVDEVQCAHLDELVDRIFEEDQKLTNSLLASDVAAINAIIVILRRLDQYVSLFSYKVLKDS
jgi:uncharacterized protein (DUF2267 family)